MYCWYAKIVLFYMLLYEMYKLTLTKTNLSASITKSVLTLLSCTLTGSDRPYSFLIFSSAMDDGMSRLTLRKLLCDLHRLRHHWLTVESLQVAAVLVIWPVPLQFQSSPLIDSNTGPTLVGNCICVVGNWRPAAHCSSKQESTIDFPFWDSR